MNAIQLSLDSLEIPSLNNSMKPEDLANIPDLEFKHILDNLWDIFNKAELQVDIRRGQALRIIRDKEKAGGDSQGKGFLNWLKEHDITKSRAYSLIDLANKHEELNKNHDLKPDIINLFSKSAFIETAKADVEVQKIVLDSVEKGDRVTKNSVKQLNTEYKATNSDLIDNDTRSKINSGALPAKYIAPLVDEMEKLPDTHKKAIQSRISEDPTIDNIKALTKDAKHIVKLLDSNDTLLSVDTSLDINEVLAEATRLDCVGLVSNLTKKCSAIEVLAKKLKDAWKVGGSLSERLFVETGSSTPNLRKLLGLLDKLTSNTIEVPDLDGNTIRLQFTLS